MLASFLPRLARPGVVSRAPANLKHVRHCGLCNDERMMTRGGRLAHRNISTLLMRARKSRHSSVGECGFSQTTASSSTSSTSAILPAMGGILSVCMLSLMYKLKNDSEKHRRLDKSWNFDEEYKVQPGGGILSQTRDNASAIGVLGKVLYFVVQQELGQDDMNNDEEIPLHDSMHRGDRESISKPFDLKPRKRDLEGNVTYLLEQLSHNPALHKAIESQALPLLLRLATTPSEHSTLISQKELSAMSVLNNLVSQH